MKVGLFIPCYVDALYPQVGVATSKLLHCLGVDVTYPPKQTCCGQPMANAGFERMSRPLVEKFEKVFKDFDYVVIPSVSCSAFIRFNYPKILSNCTVSEKVYDVVEFLHDILTREVSSCRQCSQFLSWCTRVRTFVSNRTFWSSIQ